MTWQTPAERVAVGARLERGRVAAQWRLDHRHVEPEYRESLWRSYVTGATLRPRGAELIGARLGLSDALSAVPFTGDPCTIRIDVHETCGLPHPCRLHP